MAAGLSPRVVQESKGSSCSVLEPRLQVIHHHFCFFLLEVSHSRGEQLGTTSRKEYYEFLDKEFKDIL